MKGAEAPQKAKSGHMSVNTVLANIDEKDVPGRIWRSSHSHHERGQNKCKNDMFHPRDVAVCLNCIISLLASLFVCPHQSFHY